MDKIKILEVCDAYYPNIDGVVGAVKNVTENLCEDADCELAVPKPAKKRNYVDNEKFVVHRCFSFPAPEKYRLGAPMLDRKFIKKIKSGGYDLIHAQTPFSMGRFAVKMAKKLDVPLVVTLHTKYYDDFMRSTKSRILSNIALKYILGVYKRADSVWTVSNGAARVLKEYGYKGEISVIHNGTDFAFPDNPTELIDEVDSRHGIKGQKNVFVFVGRMAMYKGLKIICDGLRILKDNGTDFKMIFVGGGFDLKKLKDYAEEVGVYGDCIFTGEIKDRRTIQGYYMRSDLLLFPSTFDTSGVTRYEAAAHKKASLLIVGSNAAEGTVDGRNGFLSEESGEAFGKKLVEITAKEGCMKEVGEKAYEEVYRNWKAVSDEMLSKYKEIIERHERNKNK